MCYTTENINKNQLIIIENLWNQLNMIHQNDSKSFKDQYKSFTFTERINKFLLIPDEKLLIQVIRDINKEICGYCITSIDNKIGELDSLFVSENERGKGLGELLANNSINWMKENNCQKIQVSVSYGHDSVIGFYEKLGFYPKLTTLQLKERIL